MYVREKIVLMAVTVAVAMACLGETVFSLGFGGKSVVPSAPASSATPDSQLHHPGKWMVNNYCNHIAISRIGKIQD